MPTSAVRAIIPLFVFNQFEDFEGVNLRPGNVHSAHECQEVLEPNLDRYKKTGVHHKLDPPVLP